MNSDSPASAAPRFSRVIGPLALGGVLLSAGFGAVYGFRERLFLLAFERRSLPAMRFLLALDPRLANGRDRGVWKGGVGTGPMPFLAKAALSGDAKLVELLLRRGADPNAQGQLALNMAVASGKIVVVQLLLDGGVNIRAGAQDALAQATFLGNEAMLEFLLDRGAPIEAARPALANAATAGHWEMAAFLWERGAPQEALNLEDRERVREFIRDRDEASRSGAK
jgi:hypothetical protein